MPRGTEGGLEALFSYFYIEAGMKRSFAAINARAKCVMLNDCGVYV